jgi:hypothetical protein
MPKGSIEWEYDPEDGLVLRIRPAFRRLLSEEARAHVRGSRREMLMALRSLIDVTIQKMDEKAKTPAKTHTRIKVE